MPRSDTSAGAHEKLIPVVAVHFDVGSIRRQHSRAGGAESDDVFETSDDSVGIEARAATSVMVLQRQGPTLLSTEHCRHRLSVMVLRRQGEQRMQLPR